MSDTVLNLPPAAHGGEKCLVDIDAYFVRIDYRGPATATLATLRALHERHPDAIAFEAIDVQLGRGTDIMPAAIDAKLLSGRRGGYCHEQNGLFKRVLLTLGFEVESLMARWYTATHPDSPFRRYLMAARATPQARYALRDNRLTVRAPDGRTEHRILSADEIEQALAETFGLRVEADWRPVIERAARVAPAG